MDSEKIKITGDTWAALNYQSTTDFLRQVFSNPKLNDLVESPSNLVYHYTSLTNFISIVQNQSFYFTNINYLNDRKEFQHGIDLILDILNNYETDDNKSKTIDALKTNINLISKSKRYIACFSASGDILSQWRAYTNQGKGISIGFKVDELDDFNDVSLEGKYIQYSENIQRTALEEIISLMLDFFSNRYSLYDWSGYNYDYLVSKSIIELLEGVISTYKHPSFHEEKEFRLEYCADGIFNDSQGNDVLYRSNDNMVIPYINLDFTDKEIGISLDMPVYLKNKKLPIKQIIIGPSLEYELNKLAIIEFLKKMGYNDVEVIQSQIPYRL